MPETEPREPCTQYVLDQTRRAIDTCGPRAPGSEGERQVQEQIARELALHSDADPVIEQFQVSPHAFMGFAPVMAVLLVGAYPAYWLNPVIAACLSGLAIAIFFTEFFLYWRTLDPLFPKRTSCNVSAMRSPEHQVQRRVILNAHPDAAYEWRYSYWWPKWAKLAILYILVAPIFKIGTDVACAVSSGGTAPELASTWGQIGLVQLACLPAVVAMFFFSNFRVTVPGANDNLTGCFIALGIFNGLHESATELKQTELGVVITGSEEAGLRGAKDYASAHAAQMQDVETIVISLDTFRDVDHLTIIARDLHGLVNHDRAVCRLLENAGRACGRELPHGSVPLGSSDATAFTQRGFRAAAMVGMDPANLTWYHTRRDHYDNMDPACIQAAIEVVVEAIRQYDEEGLPQAG